MRKGPADGLALSFFARGATGGDKGPSASLALRSSLRRTRRTPRSGPRAASHLDPSRRPSSRVRLREFGAKGETGQPIGLARFCFASRAVDRAAFERTQPPFELRENSVVSPVFVGGVHEPFHDFGVGFGGDLA